MPSAATNSAAITATRIARNRHRAAGGWPPTNATRHDMTGLAPLITVGALVVVTLLVALIWVVDSRDENYSFGRVMRAWHPPFDSRKPSSN